MILKKRALKNMKSLTIITVVKNCESGIEKTIKSVLEQDYVDFEYIIEDGESTDRTLEIIHQYDNDNRLKLYSQLDKGIYDAMNKAVYHSEGEYVFFLNAGDYFYDNRVLSKFIQQKNIIPDMDIYYGDIKLDEGISHHPKKLSKFWLVYEERMIAHQSIFAQKKLFDEYPFDTKYKICADRDWLIYHVLNGAKSQYLHNNIIAYYDDNGVSSYYDDYNLESLRISERYGGVKAVILVKIKRRVGELLGHKRKWRNR